MMEKDTLMAEYNNKEINIKKQIEDLENEKGKLSNDSK